MLMITELPLKAGYPNAGLPVTECVRGAGASRRLAAIQGCGKLVSGLPQMVVNKQGQRPGRESSSYSRAGSRGCVRRDG